MLKQDLEGRVGIHQEEEGMVPHTEGTDCAKMHGGSIGYPALENWSLRSFKRELQEKGWREKELYLRPKAL